MEQSKSILVVGGAGYLGCVLVEELLNRGYAVTVFDRLFFGDDGLRRFRDRVRLLTGDIRSMPPAVMEGVSAIINLAGLSNDPTAEYNPEANHQMNTVATRALAELARSQGVKRYLFRLVAPLAREYLKRQSPYHGSPGRYANPWEAVRSKWGAPEDDGRTP